ncbi:MAG TPA: response regulator transcription factor [Planctomycetota bacterium]|nr:response regulator transcription factor [Planctomycetota bacterium]
MSRQGFVVLTDRNAMRGGGVTVTRLFLVDDHELVRSSLAAVIHDRSDFDVVGEAGCAEAAVEDAPVCGADLVVMDVDMPGLCCFDALRRIRERLPHVRAVFISATCHDLHIEQALSVRAQGFVLKSESLAVLFDALERVAVGETFFSARVRARFTCDQSPSAGTLIPAVGSTRRESLTVREVQVLLYLARGLSKKEVAKLMQLSVKTIEHHSSSIMRKLDIHDRVELARYAIREGLVEA